ncbi:MAG: hypothetical protein LBH05_07100 [Deferribacteraceae bacterium]|jgi:internalin A|nr:hypothetical protein [Deferribacteraceae bacterium]
MDKIIIALLILSFTTASVCGAYDHKVIAFPEKTRLEQCIRNNIPNIYMNPIYEEDAVKVVNIRCNDPTVSSFEGIEQFPNLETISMGNYGTKISDLSPLSSLTKLIRLEIPGSEIDNLTPLTSLPNLYYLNLSENHITDLSPLADLVNLQTLILYRQAPEYITNITPLDNLTHMYILNLESNKITDITPLHRMNSLQYLHMADNRLSSIMILDNITSLRMVNFNVNMLTDLAPLTKSTELTAIYAKNNRISSVKFVDNLTKLTHLELSQNYISDASPIGKLPYPVVIALDRNSITDISSFKKIIRDGYLQELGLSYNCIPDIDQMSLYLVKNVRKDHQCEKYPQANDYDMLTIVNGDLLQPVTIVDNKSDNVSDMIGKPSGPGGCSAGAGDFLEGIILLAALVILLKLRPLKPKA